MATPCQFVSYPTVLSSGGSAGGGSVVWFNEAPMGAINGVNTAFSLSNVPSDAATLELFQDGLLLIPVTDYAVVGAAITMVTAPNFGQVLWAYYRKS